MLTLAMCTNQVKKKSTQWDFFFSSSDEKKLDFIGQKDEHDMPTTASWWTAKMPDKRKPQRARHNKGTKQLGQQKDYIPLVRTAFLAMSFKRISPLPLAPLDMNEEDSKVGKHIPYKTCCYYSISILQWFNNKWVHLVKKKLDQHMRSIPGHGSYDVANQSSEISHYWYGPNPLTRPSISASYHRRPDYVNHNDNWPRHTSPSPGTILSDTGPLRRESYTAGANGWNW